MIPPSQKFRPFHIRGKLTSRKGCKVWFKPPRDVAITGGNYLRGEIVDEVWATPDINDLAPRLATSHEDWGDYSFCAQRIRWANGSFSVRLGYYRRRVGEDSWHFGSQTTITTGCDAMKTFLERTLAQNEWFEGTQKV